MNSDKLKKLAIREEAKSRPNLSFWAILLGVLAVTGVAGYLAMPREGDDKRINNQSAKAQADAPSSSAAKSPKSSSNATPTPASPRSETASSNGGSGTVLTVSGYIINRERIELSPRYMGVVHWIGVKKGDSVTNNQVLVLLDDTEYKARLRESEGRLANAKASLAKAELDYKRILSLRTDRIESVQSEDYARIQVDAARASLAEAEAQLDLAKVYLDWTVIRSPINGVVLEKLVDPNELVVPQSFGGARGPSTALVALADPKDLQVEIDLNESDLSKVYLNQLCRVSPEAYPDRAYEGYVAEIAPEASRQKGTLQIKVQIRNPDQFLTPELSARVDFQARAEQTAAR